MTEDKKREKRCQDCAYLVAGEHGEWLCANCDYEDDIKDIHDISFDECDIMDDTPEEQIDVGEWIIPNNPGDPTHYSIWNNHTKIRR